MTIKHEKSGETLESIERLIAGIRYRAGVKNDPQTFGEADLASALLWNLAIEIQMEGEGQGQSNSDPGSFFGC
jgi:hypothetical protein